MKLSKMGRSLVAGSTHFGKRFGVGREVSREAAQSPNAKGRLRPHQLRASANAEPRWSALDPNMLGWLLERRSFREQISQLTEFLFAIEPSAASFAASNAGDFERAATRIALARMRSAVWGDDNPVEAELAFHIAVLRGSENAVYIQLIPFIVAGLRFCIRATDSRKKVRLERVERHAKVAKAIIAGKPNVAATGMRALIRNF
jgi:DNA-binding FadR family transcriptional regulator